MVVDSTPEQQQIIAQAMRDRRLDLHERFGTE